jgi:hypothetical protein
MDQQILAAIGEVAGLVGDRTKFSFGAQLRACEHVAEVVRVHGGKAASDLRERLPSLMLPGRDPLQIDWNPLRMLDRQQDEPAWTRWLGNLFRLPKVGAVAWSCLCDVVASAVEAQVPCSDENIANASDWRALGKLALRPLDVETERATADGGSIDIAVTVGNFFLVIENKLWSGWHDRPNNPQDECYEREARSCARGRKVGLVFLSVYEADQGVRRRPGWAFVTWAGVAQTLRRRLRETATTAGLTADEVAPLLLTVSAIERELLGFWVDADERETESQWLHLDRLARMARHLEDAYGEVF